MSVVGFELTQVAPTAQARLRTLLVGDPPTGHGRREGRPPTVAYQDVTHRLLAQLCFQGSPEAMLCEATASGVRSRGLRLDPLYLQVRRCLCRKRNRRSHL